MLCEPLGLGRVELTTKTANADYGEFTVCTTHVLCPCIDADAQGKDIKCLTTIVADSACGIVQYRTGPKPSSRRVCLVYAFELITTGSIQCNNNVELFCRPIASTHSWEEKKAHKDLKELKYSKEERSRSTSIMHAQLEFNAYKHHACQQEFNAHHNCMNSARQQDVTSGWDLHT